MAAPTPRTAEGAFKDRQAAQRAMQSLRRAGFADSQLSLDIQRAGTFQPPGAEETTKMQTEEGCAFIGTIVGVVLGIAAAVAFGPELLSWPSLGIVVAAGVLGGIAGRLIGKRLRLGYRQSEQASDEAERVIVSVDAADRHGDAIAILRAHGAQGKDSPLIS